jgi:hypothetical protein
MINEDDIAKVVEEEALLAKEKKEPLPDVRAVTTDELYHAIEGILRPEQSIVPTQISQLPGLIFMDNPKRWGIIAGQVNSSGYYILRVYGNAGVELCKFENINDNGRAFFDDQEVFERILQNKEPEIHDWISRNRV